MTRFSYPHFYFRFCPAERMISRSLHERDARAYIDAPIA